MVKMGYRRFGTEGYETTVSPYALKLFHQRWYMLAFTGKWIATYSLDRMTALSITEYTFKVPEDFSPEEYFSEYFGVLTDESVPMAHIIIRAYGQTPNYLRTLPLHPSQVDVNTTEDFTDFAMDIRPTYDFQEQLLHYAAGLEVLEPAYLRQQMKDEIIAMANNYQ
ncbi:MAG: WYL domain-containing protein, partial [Bacteroidaceae bacterium]|nr:WYL domain-containing protein [Bacteroidaceae bacterium]